MRPDRQRAGRGPAGCGSPQLWLHDPRCHLLSIGIGIGIGTASSPRLDAANAAPGKIGWVAKHALVDLIMTAQERTALAQVEALRPSTFLRIDRQPSEPIDLDDVRARTTEHLIALAEQAYSQVVVGRPDDVRRFMAHRAPVSRAPAAQLSAHLLEMVDGLTGSR